MLLRALQTAALNTLIALTLTLSGLHGFLQNLIYSQCIGLSIWALIDFSRLWLIRNWRAQRRWLILIVPASVALGYALGTLVAAWLLGEDAIAFTFAAPRTVLSLLAMSLVAGTVLTYYFLSREQLNEARARAESLQRQAAESQLRLLQTQLEPHMLFNTLANLRVLIDTDAARATAMLDRLIAYLRATLQASRTPTHPLQAECDRLQDNLALMAVRMGPRLAYTLDLPAELATLPVPTLLLQPLVENSIKHGLEPKIEGGRISVSARREQGALLLEVADTGVGLMGAPEDGQSFGLAQVRERLATAYGSQAAIDLIAEPAGGTRASIRFPLQP